MLAFDYCWPMRPSTRAHLSSVWIHFTDNVEDLVGSVAVGLTFKDFLTTFRLVFHVLSTNRSCQTKGSKSKTEHLSAWIAYHTDPLEWKLTYGWMSITEILFLPSWKLAVIVNLLPVLLFHQRKINAGLARKVAVSKFSWVLFAWLFVAVALYPWIPVFLSP